MPTCVALPLEDDYLVPSNEIVEHLNQGKSAPLASKTVKTTQILIDHMFELMVDGLIDQVDMKPFAHKLIHQVSSLVHKAVNVLVKKVIGKLSNKELRPIVEYYKSLEIEHEGKRYLGYKVEENIVALIDSCIVHLEAGNIEASKAELVIILEDVIENGLDIFLLETMSKVRLGMIARKLVDVTHTTIDKAVPPALHKIIDHMEQSELEQLKDFLLEFLIEDENF